MSSIEISSLPLEIQEKIWHSESTSIDVTNNGKVISQLVIKKQERTLYDMCMEYDGPDVSDIEIEFERDKVPSNRTLNLLDEE